MFFLNSSSWTFKTQSCSGGFRDVGQMMDCESFSESLWSDCDAAAVLNRAASPPDNTSWGGVRGRGRWEEGVGTMSPVLPRCGLHCTPELRGVSTSCRGLAASEKNHWSLWNKHSAPSKSCWFPSRPVDPILSWKIRFPEKVKTPERLRDATAALFNLRAQFLPSEVQFQVHALRVKNVL